MVYETSYDTGLQPFNHDKNRGKWSSPRDFFFACLGHAFKIDAVFFMPSVLFSDMGIFTLIPHFLTLGVCVIPIVFMQSFLGQFSSTGFLSVFRISPLFKGIGYVSLAINLIVLTFFSVLGAIPLFYFFYTLRPTIPWSCEGSKNWTLEPGEISICHASHFGEKNFSLIVSVPSIEFFNRELSPRTMYHSKHPEGRFSWALMICAFLIWGMVAVVAVKPIEKIGTFLRYSCLAVIGIMGLCLLRFLFLPYALISLKGLFAPRFYFMETLIEVSGVALLGLGPGWGSVLTMASYNKFDTNIFRYSWVLCVAQLGIMIGMALLSIFITGFMLQANPKNLYIGFIYTQWMELLVIPTGLTFLELPHVWSLIFFLMVILGCLNLLVVQLNSVMTSLFDEFETLRGFKKEVTLATIGIMALASIFFCSNYGITTFETLTQVSMMSQMILNLLLIIVVVWVYGRERFQRDVSFMTNRTYSTWMVNIIRYVTPIFLFVVWAMALTYGMIHLQKGHRVMVNAIIVIALFPWLCIPGYCIFKIVQATGMITMRIKRLARPTDWYPVDSTDRRRYEERFSDTEISHNLTTGNLE